MPRLSVARDHDDDANLPERREVMALSGGDVTRELEELIAALDRRVPRVEQAGEAAIARDAAALREKAINRLAQLATNSAGCDRQRPWRSEVDTQAAERFRLAVESVGGDN